MSKSLRKLLRAAQGRLRRLCDQNEVKAQRQAVRDLKMALARSLAESEGDLARVRRPKR